METKTVKMKNNPIIMGQFLKDVTKNYWNNRRKDKETKEI